MEEALQDQQANRLLEQRVRRRFLEGIRRFSLIAPGDRVLVAVSGGKDSLALLDLLGDLRRRHNDNFHLTAMHVRMANVDYRSDLDRLERMAEGWGIPFIVRTGSFEPDRNGRRSPCFLCSWHRRKLLFNVAQELGCNKIALGHHQDDILRTAIMNLTFSGTFSTMPVRLRMKKFPVTLVRPLCLEEETDLAAWATLRDYPAMNKSCLYDKVTNRTAVAAVLDAMAGISPDYRHHLWHALWKGGQLVDDGADASAGPSASNC